MTASARPIIIADGTEGVEGRALLLVSALHLVARYLAHCEFRFIAVRDAAVQAAIDALRWDTKLMVRSDGAAELMTTLQSARLYAAIAFRHTSHLALAEARQLGVKTLVAIQFPSDPDAAGDLPPRAAHDPRLFGTYLVNACTGS